MIDAENIIYTDASFRGCYGKIAITDCNGKIHFTREFTDVCCVECLELEGMMRGHETFSEPTVFADNTSAIRRFLVLFPKAKVCHVRGSRNKADKPSKLTWKPENPIIFPFLHMTAKLKERPKKFKRINEREYLKNKTHMLLIQTPQGELWMTTSKFKRYKAYLRRSKTY